MNNFAVLTIAYSHTATSIIITITTNNPCHITCYYTNKQPGRHRTARNQRGLTLPWGAYYCFVAWLSVEQQEAGDTLLHTFEIPDWSYCQTKWFAFRGTVSGELSPSVSAIFQHHHPGPGPQVEEQTRHSTGGGLFTGAAIRRGQQLTIANRKVTKLSFLMQKVGAPAGPLYFRIRRLDDTILLQKLWGDVSDLVDYPETNWEEVTFDTPIIINEEVRILAEFSAGDGTNAPIARLYDHDVKADEHYVWYSIAAGWDSNLTWDATYKYTYIPQL